MVLHQPSPGQSSPPIRMTISSIELTTDITTVQQELALARRRSLAPALERSHRPATGTRRDPHVE